MQLWIWVMVAVVMLVVEAVTMGLVSIWFAGGAVAALIAAALGAPVYIQITVFFVISALLLIFLLPYVRKKTSVSRVATNADRIIGKEGVVTEDIDNTLGSGQVRVMGTVWSAKAETETCIPAGSTVVIERIAGVRAVVKRKEN